MDRSHADTLASLDRDLDRAISAWADIDPSDKARKDDAAGRISRIRDEITRVKGIVAFRAKYAKVGV